MSLVAYYIMLAWSTSPSWWLFDCHQTIKRNNKHDAKSKTAPWLPCHISRCNNMIQSLGHDLKHPFRCIIPVQIQPLQLSMWTFLHGLDTQQWQPHKIEWHIFYTARDPPLRCSFCRGSGTWSPLLELQGGHDFLNHFRRTWPSTAQNTSTLRQCDGCWYCKEHRQTPAIALHGDALLLGVW